MKRMLAIFVLTALMLQGASVGMNITKFGDGSTSSTSGSKGPGQSSTVNIVIPAECHVRTATVNISTASPNATYPGYPEGVGLYLDGAPIWEFNGTDYGAYGNQSAFANGTTIWRSQFGDQGGSNVTTIRLPMNTIVQNAIFSVNCSGPQGKLAPLINITGNSSGHIAYSLSSSGDFNGDGYDDIASAGYDSVANIYFGGSAMDGVADIVIPKPAGANSFGGSMACAGDVNKDGYDDLVVGARLCADGNGRAYVFFGGASMDTKPDVNMSGDAIYDYFGRSVAAAGDVNKDGYDDVIIGANGNDEGGSDAGKVYLYFGGAAMDATADVTFTGSTGQEYLGTSVSGAGDVDADGYDDVLAGGDANNINGLVARLYKGGANMDNKADLVFTTDGGCVVSSPGDVNGDGYSDVLIGAPEWGSGSIYPGSALLYLGGASMDTTPDLVIRGEAGNDRFGKSVSAAGDVDQDGYADFIVCAPDHDVGAANDGRAYFFFGGSQPDNKPDFILDGTGDQNNLGESVSGGDIDGDGNSDLVVGEPSNDSGGNGAGAIYVIRGVAGVSKPKITVNQALAWSSPQSLNRSKLTSDISGALNAYLVDGDISGTDAYGNSYVDVPLQIGAGSRGNVSVSVVNISYTSIASSPDFADRLNSYITNHKAEKDASGNLTVPFKIESRTSGIVKLLNLKIVADMPPGMAGPIPGVSLDEDSANTELVDLWQYFSDDFDSAQTLNYTLSSASNSSIITVTIKDNRFLSVDASSGPQNDNWTGTLEIAVSAADRWGMSVNSNVFMITVANAPDDPVITSHPPADGTIGGKYSYRIIAIDGDNDTLAFALSQGPPNMTVNPASGLLEWTPSSGGLFPVSVTVSDGTATVSQDFNISVPLPPNHPPKVESVTVPDAWTDQPFIFTIPAKDDDGDSLGFTLAAAVDTLTVGASTGVVSWTPHQPGTFPVAVYISDGKDGMTYNFSITVRQSNRAPAFSGAPTATATVDVPYSYQPNATDADSDLLAFTKDSGPAGLAVAASSGAVSWTPDAPGTFPVILKVSDGKGGEARLQFNITVSAAVRPKITYSGPASGQTVKGSLVLSGNVTKGTRDIQKVQVQMDGGAWTDAVGTPGWTYTVDTKSLKNGPHSFAIRAFDGKEYSDVANTTLTVNNPKAPGPSGKGFIPMMDGMVALAVVAAGAALIEMGRRKRS